jgi:nicotinamide-nucleotide amidase
MIFNHAGTAAGIDAAYQSPDQKTVCRIFVMPGVPKEMKLMFQRDVLPHVERAGGGACILARTLHTFGLGESTVAERLGPLMRRDRNPLVGTTVAGGVVSVRVFARSCDRPTAQRELDETVAACEAALGDLIYGTEDETLPAVVARLLRGGAGGDGARASTVTTAESCTGGLVAKMLTDVPGSSAYFNAGFITYANQAKYERLGVPTEMLNLYGAVSEPVVTAMARNARRLAKADFAVAVSGIAGPDGGSTAKPVGTVCIALASAPPDQPRNVAESAVQTRTFNFPGDREMIRDRSAKMALAMLRYQLMGKPMPF